MCTVSPAQRPGPGRVPCPHSSPKVWSLPGMHRPKNVRQKGLSTRGLGSAVSVSGAGGGIFFPA